MSAEYVIDPSVLLQAYIEDRYTDRVLDLLATLNQPDAPELHFCELGLVESTNVLWKHVQRKNVTLPTAVTSLENLLDLPLTIHPTASYLPSALITAHENQLAVYDSVYIALAQAFDCPLITADSKQKRVALAAGVPVEEIDNLVSQD